MPMRQQEPPVPSVGARSVRVPDDRAGQRLDNFLLGQLKGAPRSLVYKLVRSGQVRVNGGRAKAERKLEAGDEVRIPPVRLNIEDDNGKSVPPKGLLAALEAAIVFEDARLLALNKWEVLTEDQQEVMRRVYPAGIPITALKRSGLTPLVAAILGLLPVEPLTGPPLPHGRDPNAPPEPRFSEPGEPVAVWDIEMGSDVLQ